MLVLYIMLRGINYEDSAILHVLFIISVLFESSLVNSSFPHIVATILHSISFDQIRSWLARQNKLCYYLPILVVDDFNTILMTTETA